MDTLEVHQREDGLWAWRLRTSNGDLIATDGGQGYENQADAQRIADAVAGGSYAKATRIVIKD
jgi:uncharacterized protein YegP (UPF0339 family)